VTQLYRELFPPGGCILDLMSGSASHLPEEITYSRVVGLGLNLEELADNARLDAFVVQNLNLAPRLPFDSAEFDAAAICQAIRHLARPVEVLREVGRVLQPGAPLAIAELAEHPSARQTVTRYLYEAGNWREFRIRDRTQSSTDGDRPFFAVIATATRRCSKADSRQRPERPAVLMPRTR
jgi:SAM-dependent methyltransferase